MFRAELLSPATAGAFARMTYTAQQPLLLGQKPGGVALGLYHGEHPAGLALARPAKDHRETGGAELLSLFIARELWGQGLGTQLLALLEGQLTEREFSRVHAQHSSAGQCTPAWERLLAKRGWSAPQAQLLQIEVSPAALQNAPGYHLQAPPTHRFVPWIEATPDQLARLQPRLAEVPPELRPATTSLPLDPFASLAVEVRDALVGWLLLHQAGPRLLRATIMYVLREWRTPQVSIALLAELVRRLTAKPGYCDLLNFAISVENAPMLRLAQRRILPWSHRQHELRRSHQVLRAAGS